MSDSSSARKGIFDRLRNSVSILPEKAPYPDYSPEVLRSSPHLQGAKPLDSFRVNFETAHGKFFSAISGFRQYIIAQNLRTGYCDPDLLPLFRDALAPEINLVTAFDRKNIDACDFGITRAAGAIAESGTIILNDATTSNRLGALAPWIHLAVIPEKNLHLTISEAIAALGADPNTVWATGPSKTADVEGILIEGVHGPGVQACLFI